MVINVHERKTQLNHYVTKFGVKYQKNYEIK